MADIDVMLDIGCGPMKTEGFVGVDIRAMPGVDVVHNVGRDPWPWPDGSVCEARCVHMVEHMTWPERVFFFNELGRVLRTGCVATIVVPHWASDRHYGDPTHEAPISPWMFYYMNRGWRTKHAPHVSYTCDFDYDVKFTVGEWKMLETHAVAPYEDIVVRLTKR